MINNKNMSLDEMRRFFSNIDIDKALQGVDVAFPQVQTEPAIKTAAPRKQRKSIAANNM